MKKFLFMLVFAFVALAASAQVGNIRTTATKTLVNAATVTSDVIQVTGQYNALTIQTVYTQVGATTSGTATVQGSVDGVSYITLTDVAGLVKGWPAVTAAIANGYIYDVVIQDVPFRYYKVVTVGAGTQTTTVATKYILK